MTRAAMEFDQVTHDLAIWHRYDPEVKAELFSTAIATSAGAFLIDPIASASQALQLLRPTPRATGIIITNENHERDSRDLAVQLGLPLYADPAAGIDGAIVLDRSIFAELEIIPIAGAPKGEIALHSPRDGGTLIVGDALINFGSHGFDLLPAKYCSNAKLMRRSLPKLLEYDFERMLFAHGTPICTKAKDRLARLLENAA